MLGRAAAQGGAASRTQAATLAQTAAETAERHASGAGRGSESPARRRPPEEHWRLTVCTGTLSGKPARNMAMRHSLARWLEGPITLPKHTSPTACTHAMCVWGGKGGGLQRVVDVTWVQ
jgi:hypothetical protein